MQHKTSYQDKLIKRPEMCRINLQMVGNTSLLIQTVQSIPSARLREIITKILSCKKREGETEISKRSTLHVKTPTQFTQAQTRLANS